MRLRSPARRAATVALLSMLVVLFAAPSAAADTHLIGSSPGQDARAAVAPARITLTFDGPVDPDLVVIFVTGADGISWPGGEITAAGDTITMPVTPSGPEGRCVIRYTVAPTVETGESLSGEVTFTLTKPVRATSRTRAPDTASSLASGPDIGAASGPHDAAAVWKLVALAAGAAALAVVVALAAVLRRARPPGS